VTIALRDLRRCFGGIVPGTIATCSKDGEPNISYLSQLEMVDGRHVAVSRQFFNKTSRNLDENPQACVEVYDPVSFEAYLLRLRFVRAETSGPLFDAMAMRIDAIASHTGMKGIFRLVSADVFEVLDASKVEGFVRPPEPMPPDEPILSDGPITELRALQLVSDRINRAGDLEGMLVSTLGALEELHGFHYSMVLVPDDTGQRLVTIASRGYGDAGIGAEVALGEGLIGAVAQERKALRTQDVDRDLRYGRAIRDRAFRASGRTGVRPEIPLPGLPDARALIAVPLVLQDRLIGVLAVESRDPGAFEEWHECYLDVVAHQIALGIEHHQEMDETVERNIESVFLERPSVVPAAADGKRHTFTLYRNDDCVFVDGEYLIRNVPGLILWKILSTFVREGRVEYSNRELRLDPSLKLPPIKDNLESRLILLRKRLEQKCPEVRLARQERGRFRLELDRPIDLIERESA
jgi:adenylate cyclase